MLGKLNGLKVCRFLESLFILPDIEDMTRDLPNNYPQEPVKVKQGSVWTESFEGGFFVSTMVLFLLPFIVMVIFWFFPEFSLAGLAWLTVNFWVPVLAGFVLFVWWAANITLSVWDISKELSRLSGWSLFIGLTTPVLVGCVLVIYVVFSDC